MSWFALLGIALCLLVVCGLYTIRRMGQALTYYGIRRGFIKSWKLFVLWLLFGAPLITFVFILSSIVFGWGSYTKTPSPFVDWLLLIPFYISLTIMLQVVPFLVLIDCITWMVRNRFEKKVVQRTRARSWIAVTLVFTIYTPARIYLEKDVLESRTYAVRAGDGQGNESKLLRIGFLGDLQRDQHTDDKRSKIVVDAVNGREPDLILVGGDWINRGDEFISAAGVSAEGLRAPLGVFSVRGDHDHFIYRDREKSVATVTEVLASSGVKMLHNEVRVEEVEGKKIAIVFLSYNYMHRTSKDEISALLESIKNADYRILLTHQFDDKIAEVAEDNVDLVLAAHTHGGQVNPFFLFKHLPLARVETPFVSGRYQLGSTTIIVTSGVGFSLAPFRFASPATVETIDLFL